MQPPRTSDPSSIVETRMQDDMEEEHQNMNEGDPGLGPDNSGDQLEGVSDAGCLDETARSAQDGDSNSELPSTYVDLEDLFDLACLRDIKISLEYIRALEAASLNDNNNHLDEEAINCLRNPRTSPVEVDDPNSHLGLDLFLASIKTTHKNYNLTQEAVLH
jgi:hypothetical protein